MNASASPAGASTALPGLGGRDRATKTAVIRAYAAEHHADGLAYGDLRSIAHACNAAPATVGYALGRSRKVPTSKMRIITYLKANFPDRRIPYGNLATIARELGTSRAYLALIAREKKYILTAPTTCRSGHPRAHHWYTPPGGQAGYCRACRWARIKEWRARQRAIQQEQPND